MNIENVIAPFVEQMLPRFSDPKTVLVMSFELYASKINDGKYRSITHVAHLMFWRPNNYTKVFWNNSPRGWKHYHYEYSTWNLECDHDSEWQSEGIRDPFSKLAQKMAKKIYAANGSTPDNNVSFMQEPKLVKVAELHYDREKQKATVEFAKKE